VAPESGVETIVDATEVLMAAYESILKESRAVMLPLDRGDNPLTRTGREK